MEVLKDLYYQYYSESAGYFELGETSEVKQANANLKRYMSKLDKNDYLSLEELTTAVAAANEVQGFVYGYACAARIFVACGIKGGAVRE